ncbi:GNAT family N-acetyltransferase [Spirochaeta isovalerica]|uniref:Two-component sensor histidine kinase/GNAT superfamily N-acetyltransferase n=1 Tax=Spirochaeta isovalerica TaxID=150 RepID=A0A841RB92_9SPIO|nr:GNAT family N-acetyltransferase [Spirochaeta isovalerica]MBB6480976.1 two-component sensor histidine kinase/GNAT superfamily N-acetyltransferase [Spirochaeta isovalerica]
MVAISKNSISPLTPELEKRILHNPLLNIDTFIIPSPYVKNPNLIKDYEHSFVYIHEGELLGYILVYADREKKDFLIYKVTTSPFGRGMGIGTLFIEFLAEMIPTGSTISLYVWEKQQDTMDFFSSMGFISEESIVYRNLIYHYFSATRAQIIKRSSTRKIRGNSALEEIGNTRHDARKVVRLLSSMVEKLALENCDRIIEDINRETTGLINILNSFRDSIETIHEVNLKDLITERIIPYIETSMKDCDIKFHMESRISSIKGSYVNISRALINLFANSIDAIKEKGERGMITIQLSQDEENVYLMVGDNGTGIKAELMIKDEEGYPAFMGQTTKIRKQGEGLGTVQIFSTIGVENIAINSVVGEGTYWTLRFKKKQKEKEKWFMSLERRYFEFTGLQESTKITGRTPHNAVISVIWQMRKMEIFLFDIIMQFSKFHNMRDVYRQILIYLQGYESEEKLLETIESYRCDHPVIKEWMYRISLAIRDTMVKLEKHVDLNGYKGELFKSYGQAIGNIMIFTLDPETGNFLVTDRKLAEHFDFVYYLKKERDDLLRGEFIGDMKNPDSPILFGVWHIDSDEDLLEKLKKIREGARRLVEIGIDETKKLAFYQTTYCENDKDINTDKTTTFGEFIHLEDRELEKFMRTADDEFAGFLVHRD